MEGSLDNREDILFSRHRLKLPAACYRVGGVYQGRSWSLCSARTTWGLSMGDGNFARSPPLVTTPGLSSPHRRSRHNQIGIFKIHPERSRTLQYRYPWQLAKLKIYRRNDLVTSCHCAKLCVLPVQPWLGVTPALSQNIADPSHDICGCLVA